MFGFHKSKMYRSIDGCCICRAKSSSSRFTDSKRYETDFKNCFGLIEVRSGDICNACVLLVKRWKKLPAGSKKNWNHVVDAKAGSSMKASLRMKTMKKKLRTSQISRVQSKLKRNNSDAHSTTSSISPAPSPSYSNQSDEGSDAELSSGLATSQAFSFLDLTYWKRHDRPERSVRSTSRSRPPPSDGLWRSESQVWESMNAPSSRLMVFWARFLISIASLIKHKHWIKEAIEIRKRAQNMSDKKETI